MATDYELSEREIEIIRLVATGASNKEIAQTLVISPNTVKVHMRNIFGKLEVASRTEATMVAIREGWVDAPGNEIEIVQTDSTQPELGIDGAAEERKPRRLWPFIIGAGIVLVVLVLLSIRLFQPGPTATPTQPQDTVGNESLERWAQNQDIPEPLMGMASARYEQKFYLIAGKNENGVTDSVQIYDLLNDTWQEGTPIPQAVWDVQAAVLGEKIFVPGGQTGGDLVSDLFWVYDPREDTWMEKAALPTGRSGYCMSAFEGKLYLFGGWDGKKILKTILVYQPDGNAWIEFGEMPEARRGCTTSVIGGKIHVIGGENENGLLNSHVLFIPQRQSDGENAWETAAPLPTARKGSGTAVLADMLYIAGGQGEEAGQPQEVVQYFPPKDTWVVVDQPEIPIGYLPAVLPYETRLYILGGELDGGKTDHQVYQAVYTILVPIVR